MSGRLRIDYALVDDAGSILEAQAGFVGSSSDVPRAAGTRTYARGAYAAFGATLVAATARLASRVEQGFQACLRAHALAAERIAATVRDVDKDLARTVSASQLRGEDGDHEMSFNGRYGPASRRPYDPARAGGPVVRRDATQVLVSPTGVDAVEAHLVRFVQPGQPMAQRNAAMLERLKAIRDGELIPTIYDQRFYTHELDEAQRYAAVGLGGDSPLFDPDLYDTWNNVHTAALEDYGIADGDNYLPELKL